MNCPDIFFRSGSATRAEILAHLTKCDRDFSPPLHTWVDVEQYSTKIALRAVRFEAWQGETLVGLVAAYLNDRETRSGFITNVSVLREFTHRGIGTRLVTKALESARAEGFETVSLEVTDNNLVAIRLYEKLGFVRTEGGQSGRVRMRVECQGRECTRWSKDMT
ncbi:GNAT family N-acetyltransferase [Bradyrhizobium sp.]